MPAEPQLKELVNGCIRNDRQSQERLYKTYFPAMIRMCFKYTKDQDKAVMIVNDGFLKVFQKIHLFEFKGSLEGWIRKLVFHAISDHFKKENKQLKYLMLEDYDAGYQQNILPELYFEELLKLVDYLPFQTQRVFRLYAIEGFTHIEIGEKLGISEGTSKWHLSEARKKLKALIYEQQNNQTKHA